MRCRLIALSLVLCACGARNDYAGAALSGAMALGATAVYRAATDGCWGNCAVGEECDEASGMCVAAPCRASCRADHRCMWVDGQEACVAPRRAAADQLQAVESKATKTTKPTNHVLCAVAGLLDCPPSKIQLADEDPEVDIIGGL